VSEDVVRSGFVRSLAKPGGNTTGVSILSPELDGKRQEILMEAVPGIRRMAALADSNTDSPEQLQALQEAARTRARAFDLPRSDIRRDRRCHRCADVAAKAPFLPIKITGGVLADEAVRLFGK
jgi:hypothetical protein